MMTTGYAMVSAEDFTDAETLAEMDAFTGAAEAEITEAQPEAAQTPEAQPEAVQETAQPEASQTEEFSGNRSLHRRPGLP